MTTLAPEVTADHEKDSPGKESEPPVTEKESTDKERTAPGGKPLVDVSSLTRWNQTIPASGETTEGSTAPTTPSSPSIASTAAASATPSASGSPPTTATLSSPSTSSQSDVTPSTPSTPEEVKEEDPMAFLHNIDLTLEKERRAKEKAEKEKADREREEKEKSPFPLNDQLNQKLILWQGDILTLDIECVVNTTNEKLTDKSGLSGRIFRYGGPELVTECQSAEGCPTGDAILTKGHGLVSKYIIHTVGPRYSVKYQTAAENALHGCYRRSLEVLTDHKLSEIAFPVVNIERKSYPKVAAAHVAIRTVRRFLEKWGENVRTIVFAMDNSTDVELYEKVLPLYFPRTLAEERAALGSLPKETGNELGEKVIPERKIRIDAGFLSPPKPTAAETKTPVDLYRDESTVTPLAFHEMQDNPDDVRRIADSKKSRSELAREAEERLYLGYLRRAQDEDLRDMQALNFIYQSGVDQLNRPIIVFVASQLPADSPRNLERVILYMIKVLDPIVTQDYNVVYFHANIQARNKPPFAWLKEVYGIFNRKYKKNLKRLFIVHPNFWVKLVLWFANPFVSKKFWRKVQNVQRLFDLYEFFDPKTLLIPEAIRKFDLDMFGAEYASSSDFKEKTKGENDSL